MGDILRGGKNHLKLSLEKPRQACCYNWIRHYAEFIKAFAWQTIIKINQLEKNKDPVPWHRSIKNVAFHYEIPFVPCGKFWIYTDIYMYMSTSASYRERKQARKPVMHIHIYTGTCLGGEYLRCHLLKCLWFNLMFFF